MLDFFSLHGQTTYHPKQATPCLTSPCWTLGSDFGRERLREERGAGEFSYIDQYQTETMLGGGGTGKRKMRGEGEGGRGRGGGFQRSLQHLNFQMDKEHYQKRKFHCRPVDNPTAMHQSMKITVRSSVRSFPTSRTILVDSFVWLCYTRRHQNCTIIRM
jgi:hypothetical protein